MEASISGLTATPNVAAQRNAAGMKGWMKFMGVLSIIGGGINALTIVGILWAWLPIWLGIILVQAGSRAGDYAARGDAAALEAMTGKLKTYFVISGIVVIVSMALSLISFIVMGILLAAGAMSLPDLMNRFSS